MPKPTDLDANDKDNLTALLRNQLNTFRKKLGESTENSKHSADSDNEDDEDW